MTRALLTLAVVVASSCGGNWSDGDLTYASALPWPGDLALRLPAGTGPSPGWTATRAAADDVNALVSALLGVMDEARATAPSSRGAASRAWGPFSTAGTSGAQLTLEVQRAADDRFTWSMPLQRAGAQPLELLRGETLAGETLRAGTFTAHAELGAAQALLALGAPLDALDTVDLSAAQGATPRSLELTFTARAGATIRLSPTGYRLEAAEGVTTARFTFSRAGTRTTVTSAWRAMGDGRATGTLAEGPHAGATWTECWGTTFETRFLREDWPGGATAGDPSACALPE